MTFPRTVTHAGLQPNLQRHGPDAVRHLRWVAQTPVALHSHIMCEEEHPADVTVWERPQTGPLPVPRAKNGCYGGSPLAQPPARATAPPIPRQTSLFPARLPLNSVCGFMAVGQGIMAVGRGIMAVGRGIMAVGRGIMAVGRGIMAVGRGIMAVGRGIMAVGRGIMAVGPGPPTRPILVNMGAPNS